MIKENIYEEIQKIINSSDEVYERLKAFHPFDLASTISILSSKEREKLYTVFNNKELAEIFSYLDEEDSKEIVEVSPSEDIALIINEMEPDDAYELLTNVKVEKAQSIIELLDDEAKTSLQTLIGYEEGTAGSIMNTNFLKIESGKDIKDLMRLLVSEAPDLESINTSFVVDKEGKLLGKIDLKKIIMTKAPERVDAIMDVNYTFVEVNEKIEQVIKKVTDYDIYDLPVLEQGILKGIITIDDALETYTEEADEDYARLAGLTDVEDIDDSVKGSIRKRFPVLATFLILNVFVATIISAFDFLFTVPSLTVITIFQPLLLDLSGNSGTQSLGITLQKISSSSLNKKMDIYSHFLRELIIGILSGIILGILVFLFTSLFLYFDNNEMYLKIALVTSLAVCLGLIIANLFGTITPILLSKLNRDPAVASGPFITTFLDIATALIYFSLTAIIIYQFLV